MFRVDVDAHIDESEATWEYLDDGARRFKPVSLDPGGAIAPGDALADGALSPGERRCGPQVALAHRCEGEQHRHEGERVEQQGPPGAERRESLRAPRSMPISSPAASTSRRRGELVGGAVVRRVGFEDFAKGGGGRWPMVSLTADPCGTDVPGFGLWRSTVPMLLHVGSRTLVTRASRPSAVRPMASYSISSAPGMKVMQAMRVRTR